LIKPARTISRNRLGIPLSRVSAGSARRVIAGKERKLMEGFFEGGIIFGGTGARAIGGSHGTLELVYNTPSVGNIPQGSKCIEIKRAVPEQYRGKGIGTDLLAEAEAWAKEEGFDLIWAETGDNNAAAMAGYAKRGWEKLGEYKPTHGVFAKYAGDTPVELGKAFKDARMIVVYGKIITKGE